MTDKRQDPRFERDLRDVLGELDPGDAPASLSAAVAAVPGRSVGRGRSSRRPILALGGLAAALVIAVIGLAAVIRSPATVGPQPSLPMPTSVRLELVVDDPLAALDDIVVVLEARLAAADIAATVGVAEGRIVVEAEVDPTDAPAVASLTRLVTARGRAEALATGLDEIAPGQAIEPDAYPVLFRGEDVATAELVDDGSGQVTIHLALDDAAADRFAEYTAEHVGETFAVTVDGNAVLAPTINEAITDGAIQITAGSLDAFDPDEAGLLEAYLLSGPLPERLRVLADGPPVGPSPAAAPVTPGPTDARTRPDASPTPSAAEADALLTIVGRVRESCCTLSEEP